MKNIQENLFHSIALCDLILIDIGQDEQQNETQMRRFKAIEVIKDYLTKSVHTLDEEELKN